jgi:hypothetical protein
MVELTEKRLASLLWILKNKERGWSIFELTKGAAGMLGQKDWRVYKKDSKGARIQYTDAALTYSPTHSFVKELEEKGFLHKDEKTSEYRAAKAADLIKLVSLARPFNSLKAEYYHSPSGFLETIKMVGSSRLPYALTLFAGSELYRQYVKTDQVHAYIREGGEEKWGKYLLSKKCRKVRKNEASLANLFLIPTSQGAFFNAPAKVKGFSVAPAPILLSDLLSFGGLGEEQASFLMEEWLNNRL